MAGDKCHTQTICQLIADAQVINVCGIRNPVWVQVYSVRAEACFIAGSRDTKLYINFSYNGTSCNF